MPRRKSVSHKRMVVVLGGVCVLALLVAPLSAAPPAAKENSKAAEQVRNVFKTEADQGSTGNRRELLADVIEKNPDFAPARWQSGYVQHEGKWRTPDEIQAQVSSDPRWQEYQRLRAEATAGVNDQIALAQWCRRNKLEIEERFHWLQVLQTEPNHPEALARLHLRMIGGVLLTPEQHERYLALRRKVDADIKTWKPRVTAWQRAIERGTAEERQAALEQLSQVADPAAVLVLEWSVRSKDLSHQAIEFRRAVIAALSAMKNQPATEALARIAATATEQEVCDAAADALKARPIRSYASRLLAAMAMPVESEFTISNSEGGVYYQHRFFRGGAEINDYAEANTVIRLIGVGKGARESAVQTWNISAAQVAAKTGAHAQALIQASQAARTVEIAVARQNQVVLERNQRLKYVLTRATAIDLPSDPESWWNWWHGYNELEFAERPVRNYSEDSYVEETYFVPSNSGKSCFARSTPVWTLFGKKPIESIQVGDRVLSQNPVTGELAYMPVLRTTVRAPSPTINIALPGETLTATRGHNFWRLGSGWAMAKELPAGATVYAMPANVTIDRVTEAEPAEAYNLIVAEFSTYFVGENRILSHDNTVPAPNPNLLVPGLSVDE